MGVMWVNIGGLGYEGYAGCEGYEGSFTAFL